MKFFYLIMLLLSTTILASQVEEDIFQVEKFSEIIPQSVKLLTKREDRLAREKLIKCRGNTCTEQDYQIDVRT
uniref:Putative secreted protein n=1 Tax=Panstrongylus lignarius TaxID=156445 RepID=A0A224Y5P1_9HEMI